MCLSDLTHHTGVHAEASRYLQDPTACATQARKEDDYVAVARLQNVFTLLATERCSTFLDCIARGRQRFESEFSHWVQKILRLFPEDSHWAPPRRRPQVLTFDSSCAMHAAFVQSFAVLTAIVWRVTLPAWATDSAAVARTAAAVQVRTSSLQIGATPAAVARQPAVSRALISCLMQEAIAAAGDGATI